MVVIPYGSHSPEAGESCCPGLQLSLGRAGRAQRSADGGGGIAGAITVSLHRAAGKASFVPEVLAGTLLPGLFLPRAEILCPRPSSLEETSFISTSAAGGILN